MIDPHTVQRIKDTADIVEVVSDYVHLVRKGANYMGLCPFHNERTPSFSVNKARNFCYCFSCHKGGSPVNFIMEKEGISYHDALLQLAKKYGIEVKERELTDEERALQGHREGMLVANEWAMKKMGEDLISTEEGQSIGLQYLYGRGVTPEAIKQFHLGYALDAATHLTDSAVRAGFDIEVLKSVGLTGVGRNGNGYDRFRGRVIFPVINSSGKVVAFGGRDLKGGLAKYINSPESDIYHKSNELYGMFQARPSIVREDRCFLVEGYLDVIGMWQSGIQNVVASSGTALTDNQIALIHRFTKNVTLVYDGDSAGIKAALRGIDMLLSHNLSLKVLLLPEGEDPDSWARKCTPEKFREFVKNNQTDMLRFKATVLLAEAADDPQQRVAAIQSVVESIACISDKVTRDIYIQECSSIMSVSQESVMAATEKARGKWLQKLRSDREKSRLKGETVGSSIHGADAFPPKLNEGGESLRADVSSNAFVSKRGFESSPLQPLERDLTTFCVRYGLMDFCMSEDGQRMLTLVEYIDEELSADGISLTVPVYKKAFARVKGLIPNFRTKRDEFLRSLDNKIESLRQKGYAEIAARISSINDIKKEERQLEQHLNTLRHEGLREFAHKFASSVLASDSDDELRKVVTEMLSEKHTLSSLYLRTNPTLPECDRLDVLVPRALTVLRDGILGLRLKELMNKMKQKGLTEEDVTNLQTEISAIVLMRAKVAKNIGDRVLTKFGR